MKRKAFQAALPHTLPICVGFLFLGMSYGFLMRSKGFPFYYPLLMSLFIFAGSMEFVTLLNHIYWVTGATLGALLGYVIHFDTTGIEFVMTALFVVIFLDQWEQGGDHKAALTGVACAGLCLVIFGSQSFILPAMLLMVMCFSLGKGRKEEA